MTAPVIRAGALSKRYQLGTGYGYATIRETLSQAAARALGRRAESERKRLIWALKDVSFEIEPGELVGVIGRNGAGKSTVLKILARITRPTSGWAETTGRVGCLLEVGTGFHPELTGRENVFLSGAILGMRRAEILRRFDEIVAFAELDEFLDTPIKRYSSGMQVRLAFAVAAHLEPEILIVDEVLAVGDIAFQRKCLGKMGEVTSEGRTVLFVSHNMSLVQALCHRGILLANGSVALDGPVHEAVRTYLEGLDEAGSQSLIERADRRGWGAIKLTRVETRKGDGTPGRLVTGEPARFVFAVTNIRSRMSFSFTILNRLGQPITTLDSALATAEDRTDASLDEQFECVIDELLLMPGRYRIDVTVHGQGHLQDQIEGAAFFDVDQGTVRERPLRDDLSGDVVMPHRWRHPEADGAAPARPSPPAA